MRLFGVRDVVDRAVVVCCRRRHLDLDRRHHHHLDHRHRFVVILIWIIVVFILIIIIVVIFIIVVILILIIVIIVVVIVIFLIIVDVLVVVVIGSGRPDRVVPRGRLGRVRKSSKSVPGLLGPQNVKIVYRDEYKNRSFLTPVRNRDFRLLGRVGFWRGRILVL